MILKQKFEFESLILKVILGNFLEEWGSERRKGQRSTQKVQACYLGLSPAQGFLTKSHCVTPLPWE